MKEIGAAMAITGMSSPKEGQVRSTTTEHLNDLARGRPSAGDVSPEIQRESEGSGINTVSCVAHVVHNLQVVGPAIAISDGLKEIRKIEATDWSPGQKGGHNAEAWHTATFNADAARKGTGTKAIRTASDYRPTDVVDIELRRDGVVVGRAQSKYIKAPPRTTFEISDKKYDGQQKIVPADQAVKVRELAAKRGTDGLGEKNYADTAQNADAVLTHEGVRSQPLKHADASKGSLAARLALNECGQAARSGAFSGAVIGGALAAATNIKAVFDGEKELKVAGIDLVMDTCKAATGGAVSAVTTSAVAQLCGVIGLRVINRSGAPGALATFGLAVAKDSLAVARGQMKGRKMATRSVDHLLGAGGAWAGAAAGAAACSVIPVVGTVVGGLVGGMIGAAVAREAGNTTKRLCGLHWRHGRLRAGVA